MENLHPTREVLARFVQDALPYPWKQRTRKHVSVCVTCKRKAHRLFLECDEATKAVDYETAFHRAAEGAAKWLESFREEELEARHWMPEILQLTTEGKLERLRSDPRIQSLKFCQLLLHRCRSSWFDKPVRAVDIARMAVIAADHLRESRYGSSVVADAQAQAWGHLANSHRVIYELSQAEVALQRARDKQALSGDPLTECVILSFLASLRRSQGRFNECTAALDRVIMISRDIEDRNEEGRALILKGTALGDRASRGRYGFEEAIRSLRKGIARIDRSEPELLVAAQHNVLFFLCESGRPYEAQRMLRELRHLYLNVGGLDYLARLSWLEGIIAEAHGSLEEANGFLWKSRELLTDGQRAVDVAFVTLRLGVVLSRQGRRDEARRIVGEIIPGLPRNLWVENGF